MKNAPVRKWFYVVLSLAVSCAAMSLAAQAEDRVLMGSLGDSITAATFANAPIPNLTRPLDRPLSKVDSDKGPEDEFLEWVRETLLPDTIIANKKKYSWASGEDIDSHFVRLRDWMAIHAPSRTLERLNASFPGDRTDKLEMQAQQIADAMATGDYSELAYVTVLIGANDACDDLARTPDQLAVIQANLQKSLKLLNDIPQVAASAAPVPVLVSSLPRIPDLGREEITAHDTVFGLSCKRVRDEIQKSCVPLTVWSEPAARQERLQLVDGVNRAIQEVVAQAAAATPHLSVVYSSTLFRRRVALGEVAADCFHPNEKGQNGIAAALWNDQPWFK